MRDFRPALLTAALIPVLFSGTVARADDLVCAAVYACDERGEVLPEFRGGECEAHYRAECARERVEQGAACSDAYTAMEDRSKKLEKRVKRLHKLLKVARRSSR